MDSNRRASTLPPSTDPSAADPHAPASFHSQGLGDVEGCSTTQEFRASQAATAPESPSSWLELEQLSLAQLATLACGLSDELLRRARLYIDGYDTEQARLWLLAGTQATQLHARLRHVRELELRREAALVVDPSDYERPRPAPPLPTSAAPLPSEPHGAVNDGTGNSAISTPAPGPVTTRGAAESPPGPRLVGLHGGAAGCFCDVCAAIWSAGGGR